MRFCRGALVTVLLSLLSFNGFAEPSDRGRVPIALVHSGTDNVGTRLALELRDAISSRNGLRLTPIGNADPTIIVHVSTMDMSVGGSGMLTAASIAITYNSTKFPFLGFLLSNSVYGCGLSRIANCAKDVTSDIENQLQKIRTESPVAWKSLTE